MNRPTLIVLLFLTTLSSKAFNSMKGPIEYLQAKTKDEQLLAIASKGTLHIKEVKEAHMVPRGSAVLTPSGDLSQGGIKHIIHAAPGAMTKNGKHFDPTLKGLKLSLQNTLVIAEEMKLSCLAVPFIGGGIFLNAFKMTKKELAEEIVKTIISKRSRPQIVLVAYGEEDTSIFKEILTRKNPKKINLVSGSITDYDLHKCETIVNAANMEIMFGGGISGVIARATGKADAIDAMAQELIRTYYKRQ